MLFRIRTGCHKLFLRTRKVFCNIETPFHVLCKPLTPSTQLTTACLGPQSVQQMVIGLSTGHFPWEIQLSTIVSVLSLSWGASRAFFVERVLDEADPDPAVLMVLLRVFPFMLVVILNSMMTWTSIGGLIGILVFPALLINFTTTFSLVRTFTVGIEKPFTCLKAAVYSLWLPPSLGRVQRPI